MKDADLQKLSNALPTFVSRVENSQTEADANASLTTLVKLNSIVSNEEKRKFDERLKEEQFALEKDHTYSQDKINESRLKEDIKNNSERNELEKRKFEQQVSNDSTRNDIEKLRLEIEKDRLAMQRMDCAQKVKDSHDEKMFRWISFGVTTGLGLVTTIVPILVYRKLAYTNLKLIYKDEGRPSTEYKDAIKSVQNLIRKK